MRRRWRVVGRARPPPRVPGTADGAAVVLAVVVAATIAARTTGVQQGDWPTTSNVSVMHNVSAMIERLLDNYDIRLRPQFGGMHLDGIVNDQVKHLRVLSYAALYSGLVIHFGSQKHAHSALNVMCQHYLVGRNIKNRKKTTLELYGL